MYNENIFTHLENRKFINKFEVNDLLPSNFDNLILQNVFVEVEAEPVEKMFKLISVNSTELDNIDKNKKSTNFDFEINHNSKKYKINPDILTEIYITIKFYVEEIQFISEWEINEIETNLFARISKTEKINYVEDLYKNLFLEIQKEPEYFVFTGKKEFNGFDNWEQLIKYIVSDTKVIEKYLTNWVDFCKTNIPEGILIDWGKYFRVKYLTDFCKEKLAEIQNSEIGIGKQKNIDCAFQVSLLEEILNLKDWANLSANKKGEILSHLLGKNKDNIKNVYLEFAKPKSEISNKYLEDVNKASELIKKYLG